MENQDEGVKPGDETPTEEPTDNKDLAVSEDVKTLEEKVDVLLQPEEKRILVDKSRFNDRNDKAKLYETFAPVIDKIKDNPELVAKLLETKEKGSLEDRVALMEQERIAEKRKELKNAVTEALSKWKGFDKEWPEIKDQVEFLSKKLPIGEAIRRSYLALHPELAEEESKRIANENINSAGQFRDRGGYAPTIIDTKESPKLNEREKKVAQSLLGKDFGNGLVLIKSEEDYAELMKKHESHLRATGFYDLP